MNKEYFGVRIWKNTEPTKEWELLDDIIDKDIVGMYLDMVKMCKTTIKYVGNGMYVKTEERGDVFGYQFYNLYKRAKPYMFKDGKWEPIGVYVH